MSHLLERIHRLDRRVVHVALVAVLGGATGLGSSCGAGSAGPAPAAPPPGPVVCNVGEARVVKVSGDGQTATAGFALADPLEVRVEQCFMETSWSRVSGASVAWTTSDGSGGRFDPAVSVTDAQGFARTTWTLGPAAGPQGARASVSGKGVVLFDATATAVRNCGNTGTDHGDAIITGNETWTLAGSPHRGMFVEVRDGGSITIEAGATVCVHQLIVRDSARLFAFGTASSPIVFTTPTFPGGSWNGLSFLATTFAPVERSSLRHVVVENAVATAVVDDYPIEILDSRFVQGSGGPACPQLVLENRALRPPGLANLVARSEIVGFGCPAFSGVYLNFQQGGASGPHRFQARVTGSRGVGVEVFSFAPDPVVALSACEVTGSASHGVWIGDGAARAASVSGCNLTGNGGDGVHFEGAGTVAAVGNWWGDAAGPAGPAGDGASAGVNASSPLAAPVSLGY